MDNTSGRSQYISLSQYLTTALKDTSSLKTLVSCVLFLMAHVVLTKEEIEWVFPICCISQEWMFEDLPYC